MSTGSDDRRSIGSGNAAEYAWLALWAAAWQTPVGGLWRQAMAAQSDAVLAWWKAFGGGVPGALGYTLQGVRLGDQQQRTAAWPARQRLGPAGRVGAADLRAALGLLGDHDSIVGAPAPAESGAAIAASAATSKRAHRQQHAPVPAGAGKRKPVGQATAPAVRKAVGGTVARGVTRIKRPAVR